MVFALEVLPAGISSLALIIVSFTKKMKLLIVAFVLWISMFVLSLKLAGVI